VGGAGGRGAGRGLRLRWAPPVTGGLSMGLRRQHLHRARTTAHGWRSRALRSAVRAPGGARVPHGRRRA
jgi:hypothetical protein